MKSVPSHLQTLTKLPSAILKPKTITLKAYVRYVTYINCFSYEHRTLLLKQIKQMISVKKLRGRLDD